MSFYCSVDIGERDGLMSLLANRLDAGPL